MSNGIVNPLIDGVMNQLTVIKSMLGESQASLLVEGCKTQLEAVKLMNGTPQVRNAAASAITGHYDGPRPEIVQKPAPKTKPKRKYKKHKWARTGQAKEEEMQLCEEAIKEIVIQSTEPVGRKHICDTINADLERFGLVNDCPDHRIIRIIAKLIKEGFMSRSGSTSNVVYHQAKK